MKMTRTATRQLIFTSEFVYFANYLYIDVFDVFSFH